MNNTKPNLALVGPYREPCARCVELQAEIDRLKSEAPVLYPYQGGLRTHCVLCGTVYLHTAFKVTLCDGYRRSFFGKKIRLDCPTRQHTHWKCPRCGGNAPHELPGPNARLPPLGT
jgi:hypothetical protein